MMPRTLIRPPVTFISRYLDGLTSAAAPICHHSLTTGSNLQLRGTELERAASPMDGCDYKHWLVVMDPPIGYPRRHQIVERYVQTLASALGSEEEAKKSMYSVSTKYYYAFGCNIDENVIGRIKSMPDVRWVLPDSHIHQGNNDYGGEPITDGCVAHYQEMFHEDWLLDRSDIGSRRRTQKRRSRGKEEKMNSD